MERSQPLVRQEVSSRQESSVLAAEAQERRLARSRSHDELRTAPVSPKPGDQEALLRDQSTVTAATPHLTAADVAHKTCFVCLGSEDDEDATTGNEFIHACSCSLMAHQSVRLSTLWSRTELM